MLARLSLQRLFSTSRNIPGVVVGKLLEINPHPNADRVRVCSVAINKDSEPLAIICAAPNLQVGMHVAVATIGSKLPNHKKKVKKNKLRGVMSHGMLCSELEIGMSEDHEGIASLPLDTEIGSTVEIQD